MQTLLTRSSTTSSYTHYAAHSSFFSSTCTIPPQSYCIPKVVGSGSMGRTLRNHEKHHEQHSASSIPMRRQYRKGLPLVHLPRLAESGLPRAVWRDNRGPVNYPVADTTTNTRPSLYSINQRYGEFYIRFYSAMSGAAAIGAQYESGDKIKHEKPARSRHRPLTRMNEPANRNSEGSSARTQMTEGGNSATTLQPGIPRAVGNRGTSHNAQDLDPKILFTAEITTDPPVKYVAAPERPYHHHHHHHHKKPSDIKKSKTRRLKTLSEQLALEQSAVLMTTQMLEHDRLGRELRQLLSRKMKEENVAWGTLGGKPSFQSSEMELLRSTFEYINYRPVPEAIKQAILPPRCMTRERPFIPYIPPFPHYHSPEEPVQLNKALHLLLSTRPITRNIIPKICYNLLTSPSAPDAVTYNIIIRGLTLLRQNTLADLVFREMMKYGERPDEYTVTALLELMNKSGNYQGWRRIAKIQKFEGSKQNLKEGRRTGRSKRLMETLIIHAARFGKRDLIRRYISAMQEYWPVDPRPGQEVLTALIRFYTEKREYNNGRAIWDRLIRMDVKSRADALRSGVAWLDDCKRLHIPENQKGTLKLIDERAWYWWLRHCRKCHRKVTFERWREMAKQRGIDTERLLAHGLEKKRGLPIRSTNKTPVLGQHKELKGPEEKGWKNSTARPPHEMIPQEDKEMFSQAVTEVTREGKEQGISGATMAKLLLTEKEGRSFLGQEQHKQLVDTITQDPLGDNSSHPWDIMSELLQPEIKKRTIFKAAVLSSPSKNVDSNASKEGKLKEKPNPGERQKIPEPSALVSEEQRSRIWQNILTRRMDVLINRYAAQEVKVGIGQVQMTGEEKKRGEILMRWRQKREQVQSVQPNGVLQKVYYE